MATVKITLDSLPLSKPLLRYEAEYEDGRFYGYVIRTIVRKPRWETSGDGTLRQNGTEEVPVILIFDRVFGNLGGIDTPGRVANQRLVLPAAQQLGLEPKGAGVFAWKMPESWLAADPWKNPSGPRRPFTWGEASYEVSLA